MVKFLICPTPGAEGSFQVWHHWLMPFRFYRKAISHGRHIYIIVIRGHPRMWNASRGSVLRVSAYDLS